MHPDIPRRRGLRTWLLLSVLAALLHPASAHASLFKGETLDAVANGISWVAIIIAPMIGLTLFWLVHICTKNGQRESIRRKWSSDCA